MHGTFTEPRGNTSAEPGTRFCVAIRYAIDGDLRFISHRDELRMLTRALTRADWPVAHSRGFNPQPRVVLLLPRSVGMASSCEWAIVELKEARAAEQLRWSLARTLPPACRLRCVSTLPARVRPQPRRVTHAVELEAGHVNGAGSRIAELLAAPSLPIERAYGPGKPSRAVDIRPYIETLTLENRTLSMQLVFVDQRSARPTEVITAMHLPAAEYAHRVRRVEVEWNTELAGRAQ